MKKSVCVPLSMPLLPQLSKRCLLLVFPSLLPSDFSFFEVVALLLLLLCYVGWFTHKSVHGHFFFFFDDIKRKAWINLKNKHTRNTQKGGEALAKRDAVARPLVIGREAGRVGRLSDLAVNHLLKGVVAADLLAGGSVDDGGEHEMHVCGFGLVRIGWLVGGAGGEEMLFWQ